MESPETSTRLDAAQQETKPADSETDDSDVNFIFGRKIKKFGKIEKNLKLIWKNSPKKFKIWKNSQKKTFLERR